MEVQKNIVKWLVKLKLMIKRQSNVIKHFNIKLNLLSESLLVYLDTCALCGHDDDIWNLLLRVIKRDHAVPETKRKKGGAGGKVDGEQAKGFKPMNSPNELLPFFVLPDADKKELLEDIVAGRIELAAARKVAEERTSETRAFREVEKAFNAA